MVIEKHAATAAHWSAEQYQNVFCGTGASRLAIVIQGQHVEDESVQGFLIARAVDREWEIENVVVAGAARHRGLGTRLVGEFLDLARARGAEAVFLEVRESNLAACRLYEKSAFIQTARRKGYYHEPEEDAAIYRFRFS